MTTAVVIAIGGVAPLGAFQGPNSGTVTASATDNTFTIDTRDLVDAMKQGYVPVYRDSRSYQTSPILAAAASVGGVVNSVALANGALSLVSAVPDTMRQVFMRVDPGTTAITAGVCTVTYAANDGTAAQVDVLSLATPLSTILSANLSKGVLTIASAVVSGLVGGTSPKIQLGTTAALAVPVPPGAVDVTILKEITDVADTSANLGTITNAGIWTPHTVPNATHTFGVNYSTLAP
jgi:hypothetical protein